MPDFTFTNLKDGSTRSIRDIYTSKSMTMLFSWDPTQPESIEFADSFVLKFHTQYRGQGFEAVAILPEGNEYKEAARQYLATHDIKWIVAEDYGDDKGRRILPEEPWPSYTMLDGSGEVVLDTFKGSGEYVWHITERKECGDLFGIVHIAEVEQKLFNRKIGLSEYESVDFSKDGTYLTLQKATRGAGVDLVIVGESYQDIEIRTGYYDAIMRDAVEAMFSVEPMKSYREYFNVYSIYAVSQFSYFTHAKNRTALHSRLSSNERGISPDPDYVATYVEKCPANDLTTTSTTIIVKDQGVTVGATYLFALDTEETYAYSLFDPENEYHTLLHESVGHGFGRLADEYVLLGGGKADPERLQFYHERGDFFNVDMTDDPQKVKWAHLIGHPRFPYVGVHRGGFYAREGMWRSEAESVMNSRWNYFNAWCRELIVRRIMRLAGEEYSFEKFLAKDTDVWRPSENASTQKHRFNNANSRTHHPPIFIKREKF